MSQTVVVDDSQYQDILYDSNWFVFDLGDGSGYATTGTTATAAKFTFNFSGTSIIVQGWLQNVNGAEPWTAQFSLDNTTPAMYTSQDVNQLTKQVNFFVSAQLAPGAHSLAVQINTVVSENPFLLDKIFYQPLPPSSGPSTPASVGSIKPQPTATVTSIQYVASKQSVPVGAIVGGALAGLCLILGAVLAIFLYRKRRKGKPYFEAASVEEMLAEDDDFDSSNSNHDHEAMTFLDNLPPTYLSSKQPSAQPSHSPTATSPSYYLPTLPFSPSGSSDVPDSSSTTTFGRFHREPHRTITPYPLTMPLLQSSAPSPPVHNVRSAMPTITSSFEAGPSASKAAEAGFLSVLPMQPRCVTQYEDSGLRLAASGQKDGDEDGTSSDEDVPPTYSAE